MKPTTQQTPHRNRHCRAGWMALILVALASCGWHLRGSYNIPPELLPIAIDSGGVGTALRDSLRYSGNLAGDEASASSRIKILSEDRNRRVLSVDRNGKADEYEVRLKVRWQLTAEGSQDSAQRVLIAPQTLRASRSYDFDSSRVLSRSDQEEALVEAMRDDLAQRILFRLQAWRAEDEQTTTD